MYNPNNNLTDSRSMTERGEDIDVFDPDDEPDHDLNFQDTIEKESEAEKLKNAEEEERLAREENKLWLNFKSSNSVTARDALSRKYAPLVKYVAGKVATKLPQTIEFGDLVGCGYFGLLDALEKFDPARGIKFKTYAVTRIRGAIYDELRSIDPIPRGLRQRGRDLEAAYKSLEEKLKRSPLDKELAEYMSTTIEDIRRLRIRLNTTTVICASDARTGPGEESESRSLMDTVESPSSLDPESMVERNETREVIIEKLRDLPPRERKVLILYYYEDLTLKEIGAVLKVTESRISQLHTRAIQRLRSAVEEVQYQRPKPAKRNNPYL